MTSESVINQLVG